MLETSLNKLCWPKTKACIFQHIPQKKSRIYMLDLVSQPANDQHIQESAGFYLVRKVCEVGCLMRTGRVAAVCSG